MTRLPSGALRVALVGAGSVGTAVASLLQRSGHEIAGVSSRTLESAECAARFLDAPAFALDRLPQADVVLIGAPEAALGEVATALAPREDPVVVHFAGSTGIAPLEPLSSASARCALHPVQACPDVATALERLPGSAWGVTCSRGWTEWAVRLIEADLQGTSFRVGEAARPLWHAAAVTTSNGISALMATGEAMLRSLGVARPTEVLGPISAGTVANARAAGGGAVALTGPVVRKEPAVIQRHLAAVSERAPELLPAYLHALRMIVSTARAAGRIDDAGEILLLKTLEAG